MSRLALVTGGTRGIGAGISEALSKAGHRVVASYAGRDEAAQAFSKATGISTIKFDVGDYDACAKAVAAIEDENGPIDILVNNAGITRDAMLHRMTPEKWRDVIRTNLDSVFNMTQPLVNGMRERGFGRIISISSVNGQKGQMGQCNYAAAKAGLIGFTRSLAQEGAFKGITANVVAPGYVATEMVRAIPENVLKEKILPLIPVGRLGEVEEIARCVVFLASDDAGFITGSTISANGGQFFS